MKKLFILTGLFALTISICGQSPSFQSLADKYAGEEGYTYVYITEYMFELAGAFAENEDPEVKEMMHNLKSLIVISASGEVNAKRNIRFADEVSAAMPDNEYKVLLKVKDGEEDVGILANESAGIIKELIITVKSPDEDLLLVLTGNIDLKAISKLTKTMDIEGLDQLKHVEEAKVN